MTDASKYINNYIEISTNALHEYLNQTLQLKTQLKLANELILEKDSIIGQLNNEKENAIHANTSELEEKLKQALQLVQEKDQTITTISGQLEQFTNSQNDLRQMQQKLSSLEESNAAMRNKISHMDSLTKQVNEMRNETLKYEEKLKDRDKTIVDLQKEIDNLNTKKNERPMPKVKKVIETRSDNQEIENGNDDF